MRKTITSFLIAALIVIVGTVSYFAGYFNGSDKIFLSNPASAYFPENSLAGKASLHEILDSAYSKHLRALEEPSLFELSLSKDKHCYRFLWLRSFDEPFIARLVIHDNGSGTLYGKVSDGAGGYEPGNIIKEITVQLQKKDISSFHAKLLDSGYWNKASYDHSNLGLDGASWVVEGLKNGRYHVVDRQSPPEGAYRDLGLFFLKLSGLAVEKVY